jgi:hypothetical protein
MAGRIDQKKHFRLVSLFGLTLTLFFAATFYIAEAQSKAPYDKERLLKVVRLNALSTQEIVAAIKDRGVDFQVNPAIEGEFRQAGARPEIVDALRGNYRPPSVSRPPATNPTTPTRPNTTTKPPANVPAGPPLSKNEIITMLQGGLPAARVEQFVEVRGVTFTLTPEISREITAAGGNRSLLGAITEKTTASNSSGNSSHSISQPPTKGGPDYEDLTDQAVTYMQSNNPRSAVQVLQQAVQMDRGRPTAYQLLGYTQLYLFQDVVSAEQAMRAAIERGGNAVFRVYHDHDGFFQTYCQGSFFVSKAGVTFKADDGNHTFAAEDTNIKDTGINGFVGSQFGAFNVKVYEDSSKKKSKTYNFAPLTTKKAESNLILSMIRSY